MTSLSDILFLLSSLAFGAGVSSARVIVAAGDNAPSYLFLWAVYEWQDGWLDHGQRATIVSASTKSTRSLKEAFKGGRTISLARCPLSTSIFPLVCMGARRGWSICRRVDPARSYSLFLPLHCNVPWTENLLYHITNICHCWQGGSGGFSAEDSLPNIHTCLSGGNSFLAVPTALRWYTTEVIVLHYTLP